MKTEQEFINQIQNGKKIALFGAGVVGKYLLEYMKKYRKDIEIVCFLDSYANGDVDEIKIYNTTEILEIKDLIDLVVMTTRKYCHEFTELFDYFNLPFLLIPQTVEKYCRLKEYIPKMELASNIFETKEDKELYNIICQFWLGEDDDKIKKYAFEKHGIKLSGPVRNYHKHYFEFINKDAIKNVVDAGVCDGIQFFIYKKQFKNLQNIYGFDPMYEKFKKLYLDHYIKQMKEVNIIDKGLWNEETEITFIETPNNQAASYIQETRKGRPLRQADSIHTIKTISIDEFKKQNNIDKIDFIKMDIEGAEMKALQGGEKTIFEDRPQMAISIYHSLDDLVDIPIYLSEKLKNQNYTFKIGHYSAKIHETVLYAIPNELINKDK